MRQSIEIRCPNLPYDKTREDSRVDHQEIVCNSLLGGVPKALVDNTENLSLLFYCSGCKMLWSVEFNKHKEVPKFKHMDCKVDFVSIVNEHGWIDIEGRRTKRTRK